MVQVGAHVAERRLNLGQAQCQRGHVFGRESPVVALAPGGSTAGSSSVGGAGGWPAAAGPPRTRRATQAKVVTTSTSALPTTSTRKLPIRGAGSPRVKLRPKIGRASCR